jgi:hypothetical protein
VWFSVWYGFYLFEISGMVVVLYHIIMLLYYFSVILALMSCTYVVGFVISISCGNLVCVGSTLIFRM